MLRICRQRTNVHLIQVQEDQFNQRPSIRIMLPDTLKALLVDDWENVTKNQQVVALPAHHSVNEILLAYSEEEKPKRTTTADIDVLEEVIMGIKEYFDKSLDKLLLYKFEREQYRLLRQKWESGAENYTDKGPLDIYGAHHLARLFGMCFTACLYLDGKKRKKKYLTLVSSSSSRAYCPNKYGSAINQSSARGIEQIHDLVESKL